MIIRRCPHDFSLTYQVSGDVPPVCLLEWFSERAIYQPIDDFVPSDGRDRSALLVLANQVAFPASYMHKVGEVSAIIYALGYRELRPLVGRCIVEVKYHAQRSVPDGSFDTMRVVIGDDALGIPLMGDGGFFSDFFADSLFREQEP
jgi:hypothetical protein